MTVAGNLAIAGEDLFGGGQAAQGRGRFHWHKDLGCLTFSHFL